MLHVRVIVRFFTFLLITSMFLSCGNSAKKSIENGFINPIYSIRGIPGVTAGEIAGIEALKSSRESFSFCVTLTTETFLLPNGAFSGFTALLAGCLSDMFGIPFILDLHSYEDLVKKVDAHSIDFITEFTLVSKREHKYLTAPIADRSLFAFIKEGTPVQTTDDLDGLSIGFFRESAAEQSVRNVYPSLSFESITVNDTGQAAQMLLSGTVDAVITEETEDYNFRSYGSITGLDILPLVFSPVSIAAVNPELEPVISVINKYLEAGGIDRIHNLYIQGETEYLKYLFEQSLTPEEKAYVAGLRTSGATLPVTMEADNFPLCFFNTRYNEFQGVAVDILKQITFLTDIGFRTVTDRYTSMEEIIEIVLNGDAVFDAEMIRTNSRDSNFIWPDKPYAASHFVLMSKADYPDLKTYQISRAVVGLVKGTAASEKYMLVVPDGRNYREYRTRNEALDALERGEIDLFMANDNMLLYQIHLREKAGYKVNISFDTVVEYSYFGFNKNEEMLCSIIGKAQNLVDIEKIRMGWVNRVYDYSRKAAVNRMISSIVFSALLSVLLFVLILQLIKNRKMTSEIIIAKEQAERSNRSKSIFLSHMSHEIRTPMNAILGIAEIQLQNESLQAATCDAFEKIYESGDLLLNIINDILDLSKIETGKLEIAPVKYDIPSLINDAIQINRMRFESMPIEFTLHIESNMPHDLIGDVLRIKQVLNNILSNAFKYTNSGKIDFYASIESCDDPESVILVFRVSDTGQGMTEEQVKKIFDEYTRFNLDLNRTTVGAGLGMTITKRLIDLMDGKISVRSVFSRGSEFTVHIPQKRAGSEICTEDVINKLKDFSFRNTTIMKKVQFLREFMPYGSVLVVDDVESNLYVAKGMLSPYGLKIDTASSGFEAIDRIKGGQTYDIIFMDHMMPKMDGIETVSIIRGIGYTHPIIALTANALIGRANMFLQNGFDAFLSKPIDSRELNLILVDFIRNRKSTDVVEAERRSFAAERSLNEQKTEASVSELTAIVRKDIENAVYVLDNIALSDSHIDDYITTVHGLKSALLNINENELSHTAFRLESAGKQRNYELLKNETPEFIDALRFLAAKLKRE